MTNQLINSLKRVKMSYLLGLMSVILALLFLPSTAKAVEVTDGDYTYEVNSGSAYLKKYNGTDSVITLPAKATLDGVTYKITTIGASAFSGNTYIEKVTIPNGYLSIKALAFKDCINLSELIIEANLEDLSKESVSTYNSESLRSSAFLGAGKSAYSFTVTFSENVTKIPAYLFATAYGKGDNVYAHLTNVVIKGKDVKIGYAAFYNCYDISTISLGKTASIGGYAFSGNDSMEKLTVTDTVTSIDSYAFSRNTALKSIVIGEKSKLSSINEHCFESCSALTEFKLPDTAKLQTIGNYSFNECTNLQKVVLSPSVIKLGDCAFRNCTSLSSVTINGNIEDCSDRSIDTYNNNDTRACVFWNTGKNADSFTVTFGEKVNKIPAYLFATVRGKSDDTYAHVTKVVIKGKNVNIGYAAFTRCFDLKTIDLGGTAEIGGHAFSYNDSLTKINITPSVTTIGSSAFAYNTALTSIVLAEKSKLTTINEYAFASCTQLPEFKLAETAKVEVIGAYVFQNCMNLKTVVLSSSVVKLGNCAFQNCTGLSSVTINGNIGDCSSGSIDTYNNNDTRACVFWNTGKNADSFTVTFGEKVTVIPAYLFATVRGKADDTYAHITSVVIPSKVVSIGNNAFNACYDLKDVTIYSDNAVVGSGTFNTGAVSDLLFHVYRQSTAAAFATDNSIKIDYLDLPAVTGLKVSNTDAGIKLTWNNQKGAEGYNVYRKENSGKYTLVKQLTKGSTVTYTDKEITDKNGNTYTYYIQSYTAAKDSRKYTAKAIVRLQAPTIKSAKISGKSNKITWNEIKGAGGYYVYRQEDSGKMTKIATIKNGKTVTYTDSDIKTSKKYTYKIVAFKINDVSADSKAVKATK